MNFFTRLLIVCLGFSMCTCISPFVADVPDSVDGIAVTASLTTQRGLQEVRIYRPAPFTNKGLNLPIAKAQVWIMDSQGQRYDYTDDATNLGWYLPKDRNFAAQIGKTYVLHILTPDNQKYESKPETIKEVSPIKKVYTESIITNDIQIGPAISGYNVLLDTEDPAAKGDYYRWTYLHFEDLQFCIQYFGVPYGQRREALVGLTCCELPCWDIERCYINCTNIMSDALINGKSITRHPIVSIPNCAKDYYIEIQQRSITKEAYDFWRTVEQLTSNNGSLFDAAPAAVRGNLTCTSDPKLTAYGFFEVSDVKENGFFINRTQTNKPVVFTCAPYPANANPLACAPCVESATRTKVKPKYWIK